MPNISNATRESMESIRDSVNAAHDLIQEGRFSSYCRQENAVRLMSRRPNKTYLSSPIPTPIPHRIWFCMRYVLGAIPLDNQGSGLAGRYAIPEGDEGVEIVVAHFFHDFRAENPDRETTFYEVETAFVHEQWGLDLRIRSCEIDPRERLEQDTPNWIESTFRNAINRTGGRTASASFYRFWQHVEYLT